jgi:flagellar motor switch protein FliN/FliY
MTAEEALLELAESTADAMTGVLEMFCPGASSFDAITIAAGAADALADVPVPGLAASVAYVDGVTGGNVFVIGLEGAKRLAATMMGAAPDAPVAAGELTELEHSAVGEAMNQMMAAAAAATSKVLGYEVQIAPPQLLPTGGGDLVETFEGTAHATTTAFTVCGQSCLFVQLVPQTFIVRMRGALDERGSAVATGGTQLDDATRAALRDSLVSTTVRLSAEVGRTRMPVEQLIGVPEGTVIELDRDADDPIDVYVNGRRFATGRLVLTDTEEWAVRIEQVLPQDQNPKQTKGRW